MTNRECHSSVTKPRENRDKGDRTVTHILLGDDFNITLDNVIDRWPPGSCSNTNVKLKMLMQRFDLIDAWRFKHPHNTTFTWCNNSRSKQSRIDLWLVSHVLKD